MPKLSSAPIIETGTSCGKYNNRHTKLMKVFSPSTFLFNGALESERVGDETKRRKIIFIVTISSRWGWRLTLARAIGDCVMRNVLASVLCNNNDNQRVDVEENGNLIKRRIILITFRLLSHRLAHFPLGLEASDKARSNWVNFRLHAQPNS